MTETDHGLSQQSSDTGAANTVATTHSGTSNTASNTASAPRKKGKHPPAKCDTACETIIPR